MADNITSRLDNALDRYVLILLALALAALTLGGVGTPASVGPVGALLCAVGCAQRRVEVDLWAVVPMVVYLLAGAAATYRVYGTITEGYVFAHAVLLAIYLLMACLEEEELLLLRRLAALWAAGVAAAGVIQYIVRSLMGSTGRLGGILQNPNALGIFLTVGYFTLQDCLPEADEAGLLPKILRRVEPVLLTALALTLSMGSFLSMAAGILAILIRQRWSTWGETFALACRLLARASLGIGLGIMMYFTARHTQIPWLCLVMLGYLLALMAQWEEFERFLRTYRPAAAVIAGGGTLVVAAAVAIRPSAIATFFERLEMMADGLSYIPEHLLLGLGPYQWRLCNLYGGGKYFNTWHIHNFLIHIAVELGIVAALALLAVIFRHFWKTGAPVAAAFLVHGMIDTGFFYLGITAIALVAAGEPRKGGRKLKGPAVRLLFAALFVLFLYCTLYGRFHHE